MSKESSHVDMMMNGNSVDIRPNRFDSEIKADIVVSEVDSVRLWGQILDCDGNPVTNALLKLVRVVKDGKGRCEYQGISHSISDCQGFYQFDICADDDAQYKVLVTKTAVGPERIIETAGGNCEVCNYEPYRPCGEYVYRITAPDYIDCDRKKTVERCDCPS